MERPGASLQWVGSPCGSHGSYIFYKAFQCRLRGSARRILCLGDFFPVRCRPGGHPACIAELQLLWEDAGSGQRLSSSKLYFLPEDTPQGRASEHGQDEVIAVSEKIIVKLEDLVKWAHQDFSKWKCGLQALPVQCKEWKNGQRDAFLKHRQLTLNGGLNFKDVLKEKFDLGENEDDANVIVLSYPQYCRYRSMLKRIQAKSSSLLVDQFVLALGGIAVRNKNTHIFYCRDTFDHPRLIENEKICDKFAPNLKGRPRKKKPLAQRRDSCSAVKECPGQSDSRTVAKVKNEAKSALLKPKSSSSSCKKTAEDRSKVAPVEEGRAAEQAFLVGLYKYMKDRKTPIERIPYLGFKQINLWTLFQAAHKLGGYETITARRQWKHVYDELGGNPGSTSAATCTRRHYERLLLPYERFMKGEEDKPLPPVKPRKQDQSFPEAEMKAEVLEAKQTKAVSKKGKKEKNSVPEPQKDIEASLKQEESPETAEEEGALADTPAALEELKTLPQGITTLTPDASRLVAMGKMDMSEANCSRDILKEEDTDEKQVHISNDLIALKAEPASEPTDENSERKREEPPSTKQEHFLQSCPGPVEKEPKVSPFSIYHDSQLHAPNRNCAEDDYLPQMPDYVANCTVKMDPLMTGEFKSHMDGNILKTALRQNTKVYVVQSLDVLKQKELPVTREENPTVSYAPLLYSRGNPGIMSPLAKKKLLSQVSGVSLSSSYPYGSPPALISKKRPNGRDEAPASGLQATQGCSTESVTINRPSVIQHVQSFKTKFDEDRPPTSDCMKQGPSSKADAHCCDFTKLHQNSHADSFVIKPETAKKNRPHYRVTSLLSDFYSSPHLHSLYKQTEHHLHSGQSTKLFSKDLFGESESSSTLAQQRHQEKRSLIYNPPFQHQEKHPVDESSTDDQPTDLSMPKPLSKQELSLPDTVGPQEKKPPYVMYKSENNHTLSSECSNPKACRVSPMIMSPAKKLSERNPRSGPSHNLKLDGLRRLEGTAHSMAGSKMVNVGTARPLKRSVEEMPKSTSEKKIRIVSPLHLSKETAGQETFSHQGGERSKSVHDSLSDSRLESHRYPVSSAMSSGLYAGSLCSGLNYHIPSSHSIPIHHLKIQNLYSQVMPPTTTLQSFMAQRHLLASSANSQQLYRHLAAGTPAGSPYIDLLYNNIYPLASISPQNTFPPSQLSSVHPSTKL